MLDLGADLTDVRPPVSKLVRMVLLLTLKDDGDLFSFVPGGEESVMRYRCAGVWFDMVPPPRHLAPEILEELRRLAPLPAGPKSGWIGRLLASFRRPGPARRRVRTSRILFRIGPALVDGQANFIPTAAGERALVWLRARRRVRREAKEVLDRYIAAHPPTPPPPLS